MQRLLYCGAACAAAILTLSASALAQTPVRAGALVIETPWSRAKEWAPLIAPRRRD